MKLHRSQMMLHERLQARNDANGINLAERFVRAGGTLEAPQTERDKAMRHKWEHAPLAGHQSVTYRAGPDFGKLLDENGDG